MALFEEHLWCLAGVKPIVSAHVFVVPQVKSEGAQSGPVHISVNRDLFCCKVQLSAGYLYRLIQITSRVFEVKVDIVVPLDWRKSRTNHHQRIFFGILSQGIDTERKMIRQSNELVRGQWGGARSFAVQRSSRTSEHFHEFCRDFTLTFGGAKNLVEQLSLEFVRSIHGH